MSDSPIPTDAPTLCFVDAAINDEGIYDLEVAKRQLEAGADGLGLLVRASADGEAVAHRSRWVGGRLLRRQIANLSRDQLDDSVQSLTAVLDNLPDQSPLLLSIADERAIGPTIDAVAHRRPTKSPRSNLWIVSDEVDLRSWRSQTSAVLVHRTRMREHENGLERLIAELSAMEVDGVALPHADWTTGHVALAHRFGLVTLALDAVHEREIEASLDVGVDALSCSDLGRLTASGVRSS